MIEIKEMTIIDLEKIKDILQEEFDEFWTASVLKSELNGSGVVIKKIDNTYFIVTNRHVVINKGVNDVDTTFSLDESEQRMFGSECVP